ncbi:DUF590-domain-containing protein [Clavulina sp. PMI_390]|nr:DUF590-domain-containing protein [Clavulina sp. PMI_390]
MSTVDLVVLFRSEASKDDVKAASDEYTKLLQTLKDGGLKATGKKGDKRGRILVFVNCSEAKLSELVKHDASRAFVHGLTASQALLSSEPGTSISPAERNRLIYLYVCSSKHDGGLGITPGAAEWPRVESVITLHDQEWNDHWIKGWSTSLDVEGSLESLRTQFGESLAMYFAFLSFYMRSLIVPSILGVGAFFFTGAFSPIYSALILLWSLVFVEWWGIKERKLAVQWGVRGASKVEFLRAQHIPEGDVWWKRELKIIASIPVIMLFAGLLIALMTSIFVFEAFVTQLYTGPGHQHIGLAPTVLFILLVPRLLGFYHVYAVRLTEWENHPRQSSYDRSLALKTFALASIVAYGGLALSAFVYVPFGGQIMRNVQAYLSGPEGKTTTIFKVDHSGAQGSSLIDSMKGDRLKNQVFAFTVTNQVINFVQEVVVPWVSEGIANVREKGVRGKKKRVGWEDEKSRDGSAPVMTNEDRLLVENARGEAGLPDYELYGDYNEMIMQFGYVAVWSTCWPLAPVMALINNWIELRSDAFKIAKLGRRPLPSRTDSIGAWLNALSFITWLSALINAALIFLFNPSFGTFAHHNHNITTTLISPHANATSSAAYPAASAEPSLPNQLPPSTSFPQSRATSIMLTAVVVSLLASHGYILARALVQHVLERALWFGSEEEKLVTERELEIREGRVKAVALDDEKKVEARAVGEDLIPEPEGFWIDEGLNEITSAAKME